jgi:hypothetical protein
MNPLDIALIAVLIPAGILAATFATVRSLVRRACEEHDRWLFEAYVHHRTELESWLVRGALDHLRSVLVCEGIPVDGEASTEPSAAKPRADRRKKNRKNTADPSVGDCSDAVGLFSLRTQAVPRQ